LQLAILRDLAARLAAVSTRHDAMRALEASLAGEPRDLPFAIAYLRESAAVSRAALHGLRPGSPIAAPAVTLAAGEDAPFWPIGEVIASGKPKTLALPDGVAQDLTRWLWQVAPRQALLVPIEDGDGGSPLGVLVAALSPHRAVDEKYVGFVTLLTGQVAAAIARVDAFERERARAEALAELDRAKTTFFSNVSHEFRTPLTLMLNPVEELRAILPEAAPERALLDVAHRNALRLQKLVNTLLDFARIEAGRVQASFEPVDLSAFTADLASAFRSLIEQAGLVLVVDTATLPQPVFVDRDMWEKIVLNLLSNAFKFTFAGGIDVRVAQSADASGATITVSDTGTGIPAAELPHVFERFHRIAGAQGRSIEGSGIGLALVRELVGLHGGSIVVESVAGRGTTFRIVVPYGSAHLPPERITSSQAAWRADSYLSEARQWLPKAQASPAQEEIALAPELASVSGRVLLSDDDTDMRDYVQRLLRTAGMEVISVADGRAALEAARSAPPDLVLSDVMMPDLDGFGLLAALRADSATHDVPVVLLSARAGEEARLEALGAGAHDYLVKPFNARELVARVAATLRLSQLRRANQQRTEGQRHILEMIATGTRLEQTLDAIALFVEAQEPGALVTVMPVAPQGTHFSAARGPSLPAALLQQTEGIPLAQPYVCPCSRAVATGQPVSVPDVAAETDYGPDWPETLLAHGLRAVRSTPVVDAGGRPVASLAIHYTVARDPLPADPTVIDVNTHLCAIAVERARTEAALTESADRLERANAELEQRVAEALAERKVLADMVEGTDAIVQVVDPEFRWLAVNRAAAEQYQQIFGIRPKVGLSMLDLLADQPEQRAALRAVWARALAGEEFSEIAVFGDPQRSRRTYEMKFNTLRDESGRQIGAYQFVYDVTARIENERRLGEVQAQLHEMQKLETVGQLTGGIAHDFNNLLTPIYGVLDLLNRRYAEDERASRLINGAMQSAERARVLVGRLLTFARRQDLEARPVSVPELIGGMVELIERALGPAIAVTVETQPGLPPAQIDPNQLELALLNLCINARDAMPAGGRLRIAADTLFIDDGHKALNPGRYVRLRVIDSGVGMDMETLRRAVEPFFTTKGVGRGTGLGLSMVHGLAAQSGGGLMLDSTRGDGTTATLLIPAAASDMPAFVSPVLEQATATRGLNVLLVDDEDLVRMGLRDMLEALGHRVTEAASGSAAIQVLRANPTIELLITDYMMPSMTGVALVREARLLRPDLPALLVTGYASLQSPPPGNLPRISKPFREAELANAIAGVLSAGRIVPLPERMAAAFDTIGQA
jgi:signal transduction histidine kinase/DNA-binding response OmpR family regulator